MKVRKLRQWRLIVDTFHDGFMNMSRDESIMRAVGAGWQPPTLRLYGWHPYCLSLGYGQRISDVDFDRLWEQGWGMVRRPTGGKAILHADELTYSVSLAEEDPIARGGILPTYLRISEALYLAMAQLELSVQAMSPDTPTDSIGAVCFEVPSKYEITWAGKKLIGSAQLRRHQAVLQHGTLPLYGDITRICEVLAYADEGQRALARQQVAQRATTLAEALGVSVAWQTVAESFAVAFAQTFGMDWQLEPLSDAEQDHALTLYHTVYTSDHWNLKR